MSEHYQEETWKKIFHRVVIKLGVKLGVAKYNTIKLVIKLHAHYRNAITQLHFSESITVSM